MASLNREDEKVLRDRGICPDPPLARYYGLFFHGVPICGEPMAPGAVRCARCAADFRVETIATRAMVAAHPATR